PHVCLSDRKTVDLTLQRPSPRGTIRRLFTRVLLRAIVVDKDFAGFGAAGLSVARTGTKRGNLA
ncbi:MAG: hypothetical protein WBA09_15820, partial [Candidatus Acidiferrum sp.]